MVVKLSFLFGLILYILYNNKESFTNSGYSEGGIEYLDIETFFKGANKDKMIHENQGLYDMYDKIDTTDKFKDLKDIVCYQKKYCDPNLIQ